MDARLKLEPGGIRLRPRSGGAVLSRHKRYIDIIDAERERESERKRIDRRRERNLWMPA